MTRLLLALVPLFAIGCSTTPTIVSDDHMVESPVMQGLRHSITQGTSTASWGWILWYLPVLALALAWAYREFIVKRKGDKYAAKKLDTSLTKVNAKHGKALKRLGDR
jgi:hypothetical protein